MLLTRLILSTITLLASTVLATTASSGLDGRDTESSYVGFASTKFEGTNLRYVMNSGICETTRGVTQYSGYVEVGYNMSMWFWFFEARNSPETAPFTLW
ncbi:hypothetical protein ID866_9861 [Astraeus odoratus]|nr:hypothetical protein ID866_9861 [Astraeus odoratus]